MPAIKGKRLYLRLWASDVALIRDAAATLGTSVSDYVTEAAIQRARQVLADQRHFTLGDETWDRFLEALERPARVNEGLATFLRRPSLLDDET